MKISAISNLFYKNPSGIGFSKPIVLCREDSFEKSDVLTFRSNTSAGAPLRRLKNMICPYFGTPMLNACELSSIEGAIDRCENLDEIMKILSKYKKFMLPVEKKMYKKFAEYKGSHTTLPNILKKLYPEALIKLKLEEFNVLDDVDKISLKLSPNCALSVHEKTTSCRQIILENREEDTFKRKNLLVSIDEIQPKRSEKKVFEELKERAIYLPTSGTSENAFVVKYASRTQQEIAKRLIRPSLATIEHVKPNSLMGENDISNFLLTCAGANNTRSNMPLTTFIGRFPQVKKNCQKYIDRIIAIINNFGFKGNEDYPYKIARTLKNESKSIIELDLSNFKYTQKQAKELAKRSKDSKRR